MYTQAEHLKIVAKLKETFWIRSWSIADQQEAARKDPGASGPLWVSRTVLQRPPEDALLVHINRAVTELKQGDEKWTIPVQSNVPVEWVGARAGAKSRTPEPQITELEKYRAIESESDSTHPTILFVHGGGFCYGSPIWARPTTSKLARLTRGRCIALQYRYATEAPFPAALLDLFTVYVSLLSPPPGSFHKSIAASRIVLAGESAGMNLCVAFVQILLHLRRSTLSPYVHFHGRKVPLELPAGIAGVSGFFDITGGLPSWDLNDRYDYLPRVQPFFTPEWPVEALWPSDPPRGDVYCETSALAHPLVCPIAIQDFRGSPPLWLACGEERVADASKAIAQMAARQGVAVAFEEYEAMPHCWPSVLAKLPHSERVINQWAKACMQMVSKDFSSRAERISFEHMTCTNLDIDHLLDSKQDELVQRIKEKRDQRVTYSRAQLRPKCSL